MRNMLEALKYMHERRVVHRDLKPENLILASKDNDYDLRIADFGLATFMHTDELLKLRCGSPGYVAPELLEDKGYDLAADIFSTGIILYVLLSGRPAFRGFNLTEILQRNKRGDVDYPARSWDKISAKAKDLVARMLDKNRLTRITAAEALKHPWFHQDETEINNESLDFRAGIQEEEKNREKIDYSKINNEDEEDINLVSATPVLAGRNIRPDAPMTPYLTSNSRARAQATPLMAGDIRIAGQRPEPG